IAKHTKKGVTPAVPAIAAATAAEPDKKKSAPTIAAAAAAVKEAITAKSRRKKDDEEDELDVPVSAPGPAWGSAKSCAPPKRPKVAMPDRGPAPLPLPDPEPVSKAPAERRKGDYTLPPLALLDAAKAERKIDERELMDGARLLEEKCREFS